MSTSQRTRLQSQTVFEIDAKRDQGTVAAPNHSQFNRKKKLKLERRHDNDVIRATNVREQLYRLYGGISWSSPQSPRLPFVWCNEMPSTARKTEYNKKEGEQAAEALFIRAQKVEMFTVTFALCINHLLVYSFRFVFDLEPMMRPLTAIVSHAVRPQV